MPPSGLCSVSLFCTNLQFLGSLLYPIPVCIEPTDASRIGLSASFWSPAAASHHLILPKSFQLLIPVSIARHCPCPAPTQGLNITPLLLFSISSFFRVCRFHFQKRLLAPPPESLAH